MIEYKHDLDLYPLVTNRSIVNITPKRIFLDWITNINGSDYLDGQNQFESISFLIPDFECKTDFDDWLIMNCKLLFEIRLNYSCIERTFWPEVGTLEVFKDWFEIRFSNLVIDLEDKAICTI